MLTYIVIIKYKSTFSVIFYESEDEAIIAQERYNSFQDTEAIYYEMNELFSSKE